MVSALVLSVAGGGEKMGSPAKLHMAILCSTLVKVHPHLRYRGGKKTKNKQKKIYDEASQKIIKPRNHYTKGLY
jgi:hypothetical protein